MALVVIVRKAYGEAVKRTIRILLPNAINPDADLRPARGTDTVPRKHFSISHRGNHEEPTSGDSGRAYAGHAGKRGLTASLETYAEQRRTEESGPGGIFLPWPEGASTGAQLGRYSTGGREDDAGRPGRRLGILDRDPAEIPGLAHYRNYAEHWRIGIEAGRIWLWILRGWQVPGNGCSQQRCSQCAGRD